MCSALRKISVMERLLVLMQPAGHGILLRASELRETFLAYGHNLMTAWMKRAASRNGIEPWHGARNLMQAFIELRNTGDGTHEPNGVGVQRGLDDLLNRTDLD